MVAGMKHPRLLSCLLLASLVAACGDDDGTADSTTATTTETPGSGTAESTGPQATGSTTGDAPQTTSTGDEPESTSTATDPDSTSGDGDSTTGSAAATASAALEPRSGSEASGSAVFTDAGDGTANLVIDLQGVMPPGTHALHIHEFPDCSADDGSSAGDHWNPEGTMLGELGTVEIAEDGTGVFMKSDAWSVGTGMENDVVGRSIIIHADPDGGPRIACGVITLDR